MTRLGIEGNIHFLTISSSDMFMASNYGDGINKPNLNMRKGKRTKTDLMKLLAMLFGIPLDFLTL